MSLKVTLSETARSFEVLIGYNIIGRVTSYFEKGEDNTQAYHAELCRENDDDANADALDSSNFKHVGWYSSLKEAGSAVVDHDHGEHKIDAVTEKVV